MAILFKNLLHFKLNYFISCRIGGKNLEQVDFGITFGALKYI